MCTKMLNDTHYKTWKISFNRDNIKYNIIVDLLVKCVKYVTHNDH